MSKFNLIFVLFALNYSLSAQSTLVRSEIIFFADFAQARTVEDGDLPYFYRFAHFDNIPTSNERARLETQGAVFVDYFGNSTYLVAFQQPVSESLCRSIGMDGLVMVPAASKLSRKVQERPIPLWAKARNGKVKLIVKGYKTSSPAQFKEVFASKEINIDFAGRRQCYVELTIDENQIDYLASLPEVSFVDWTNPPAVLDDDIGRGMHRSNVLNANYAGGRNFDGTGVNVLVRDDGPVGPHIDFQGRIFQDDPTINGGSDHGDMVAGIFAGSGNIEPTFKGMASGADLFVRDYNSNFQIYTMDLHDNENVVVTSSSYSDGCNAGYTALTHTIDQQIFDNQTLVHIFSAGNAGTGECGYGISGWGNITGGHKQGKNAIATGNLKKNIDLRSSSSRGPAYDGRIKPDLCAHGHQQMSTDPDNEYGPGGGTSAASPGAAGVFTQLIQAYKSLNGGAEPKSGLIKACLLNTAIDLGNVGPDFKYGWGELNGYRAVKTLENGDYLVNSIDQGQSKVHDINVASGTTQVRFMLYWMDPPAPEDAAKALINNLDLKVVSPSGDTILPWVLDYAPNFASLNSPATHGIDDLNNMEQVVFQAPEAGTYKILVNGTEVPMGPQEYFVLHSAVEEPLFMAFPVGGESFAPGEEIRIFWDYYNTAGNFTVEVSYDNGGAWYTIASVSGRSYLWSVPNQVTGDGLIRVSIAGSSAQSISNFSIMDRPSNLSVDTVCASNVYVSWDQVPDATGYDLFLLGDKYMDSIGTTTNTGISFSIIDPNAGFWYSVRAKGVNGLKSERAYAQYYSGGLLGCQVTYDLTIDNLIDISGEDISLCESKVIPIKATIRNNGKSQMSDFDIIYKKNNNAPVTVPYSGTIDVGQTIVWDAMDTINLDHSGQYSISVEVVHNDDELLINNLVDYSFNVQIFSSTTNVDLEEGFEGQEFPPVGWELVGVAGGYAWEKNISTIGVSGQSTSAVWVDNYQNDKQGEVVTIETDVINTENVTNLLLSFDYAYTNYSVVYSDSLEVVAYDVCDPSKGEQLLFYKGGNDLRTTPSFTSDKWQPSDSTDWKHEEIVISGFSDGNVRVKFNNINQWGNSLYLDNIQLKPNAPSGIVVTQMIGCVGDSIAFSTDILGANLTYAWNFGDGGDVVTTQGPHYVPYATAGQKNIELTVTTPTGALTYNTSIVIYPLPVSSFSSSFSGNDVSFMNASMDAITYFWDFGDGTTSIVENPSHIFQDTGSYTVCLTISNECGTHTTCQVIDIITDVNDLETVFPGIQLTPNPATDFLSIRNFGKQAYGFEITMLDVTGRVVGDKRLVDLQIGEQHVVDVTSVSSGIYWIKMMNEKQVAYAKIVIE